MLSNVFLCCCFLPLHFRLFAADLCNWTGSRSAAGPHSRLVLQVRLRCTQGSVRWLHPGHALRVVLQPNLASSEQTSICIKPSPWLGGASVFTERAGELRPLLPDAGRPDQMVCFRADGAQTPAIYIQATLQRDGAGGRRTMGFRYELLRGNRSAAPDPGHGELGSCRPCNNTELLMAVCNSDFVVRGSIRNVSHQPDLQTSLVNVWAVKVYWQRSGVFERHASGSSWHGNVHTHLRCHVKPGGGEFLFTGSEHFGEAWLGCAPRYKDFLTVYRAARESRQNSCDFPLD